MSLQSLSTSLPSAAAAQSTIGPKFASTASSSAKVWTNARERNRSSGGTGGGGAVFVPVPSYSSEPFSATNILVHRGDSSVSPLGGVEGIWLEGIAFPLWTLANVAFAIRVRVAVHLVRTAARLAGVAAQPREVLLLALGISVASRLLGPLQSEKQRRDSGSVGRAWQVRHVKVEVLNLVEPAHIHLVQMSVCPKPRDLLAVRSQVEVGPAACWPRRPAAQQVVLKYAKCMHNHKQFEDMRLVGPLRRCQLAALVRMRVLVPRNVWLSQYSSNGDVSCVCRQQRTAVRNTSALPVSVR